MPHGVVGFARVHFALALLRRCSEAYWDLGFECLGSSQIGVPIYLFATSLLLLTLRSFAN